MCMPIKPFGCKAISNLTFQNVSVSRMMNRSINVYLSKSKHIEKLTLDLIQLNIDSLAVKQKEITQPLRV